MLPTNVCILQRKKVFPVPVAASVEKARDVPAADCALPGASKSRVARGRTAFATVVAIAEPVAAADCALPGASKLRAARGRAAVVEPVPAIVSAADCALPGASKLRAT